MHLQLLRSRRFGPLFWTQLLGAFNDNLFKNALVISITYRAMGVGSLPPEQMVALSGAVFLLPFFVGSALAGQLADKLGMDRMIRWTKTLEIAVMAVGAVGLVWGNVVLLLAVLGAMGLQSTLFGPCKYGILPAHLKGSELVTGNALIELGTYGAILGGTLVGGLVVGGAHGSAWVAAGVLLVAVVGRVVAGWVPPAPASAPDLVVSWRPVRPTLDLIRRCRRDRPTWRAILGISWFWTYGAVLLAVLPVWTQAVLGGSQGVATLFLALFSVGIGVGSMVCERLSRGRIELGLVPLGALGMAIATADLALIGQPWATPEAALSVWAFLARPAAWRIVVDLGLLAACGGLLVVPLYALVQSRAEKGERARIVAGNNVVNAGAMVAGSLALTALMAAGVGTGGAFAALAVCSLGVAVMAVAAAPRATLRFVAWGLSIALYRIRVGGAEHVPAEGPCVVVANHVSFVDWLVLAATVRRPMRFVMYRAFYDWPVLGWVWRVSGAIPIASAKEDPAVLDEAFTEISDALRAGEVVCLFPEGRLTSDGELAPFRPGIERIVARDPVPVVPVALGGLWGSFFSRRHGKVMSRPFRRFWSRVQVQVGTPLVAHEVSAARLQDRVAALRVQA